MRHLVQLVLQHSPTAVLLGLLLPLLSCVTVTTDKSRYDPGEPVGVSIMNTLSVPIYVLTGQTYCTIVTVQRSLDGEWKPEGPCQSFAPPGWLTIAPGDTTRIELKPRLAADQALASGRYRAKLTFRLGSINGQSSTVFSLEFLVSNAVATVNRDRKLARLISWRRTDDTGPSSRSGSAQSTDNLPPFSLWNFWSATLSRR